MIDLRPLQGQAKVCSQRDQLLSGSDEMALFIEVGEREGRRFPLSKERLGQVVQGGEEEGPPVTIRPQDAAIALHLYRKIARARRALRSCAAANARSVLQLTAGGSAAGPETRLRAAAQGK